MPFRATPSGDRYGLLCFDASGAERTDDPDGWMGRLSLRVIDDLSPPSAVTDVFVFCHGWKGDIAAAIDQYDRWFGAFDDRHADRAAMTARRPRFHSYRIGVHWPSLPWGDEELGVGPVPFAPGASLVDLYAERLGDRPGLRQALAVVVQAADRTPDAVRLPLDAERAYREIDRLMAEVGASGPAAPPDADREPFDPQAYFEAAQEERSFGLGSWDLGGILAPLRQLSFWKMKQRALTVGEGGMHDFLRTLQASFDGRDVRIHLMGHSFGCIVVSAMACGPEGGAARPVASISLVQGALSLWSYCRDIPIQADRHGHFRRLLDPGAVSGPVVTTRSVHDTAVGRFYPLGAGVAGQIEYGMDEYPRYGALGAFGAQGLVPDAVDIAMLPHDQNYNFDRNGAGRLFNLEASGFIRGGAGASGAHNEIDGPEVAHAIWQASLPAGNYRAP